MKNVVIYLMLITLSINSIAQLSDCLTVKQYGSPTITPVASSVAVATRGLTYNISESVEFDYLPCNNWFIHPTYTHSNADNFFSSDSKYWSVNSGILTLKLYDDPNDGYNYTAAILANSNINTRYGYFETLIRMPNNIDLCTSFWGFEGLYNTDNYREIDVIEHFTSSTHTNVYHHSADRGGQMYFNPIIFDSDEWYLFGVEWLPKGYNVYINNYFIGFLDTNVDCVEDQLLDMSHWRLWIVNWVGHNATGTFPKVLESDYIRIYSFNTTSINLDFYNNKSLFDFGVWKTIHLGDTYSSDATFDGGGRYALRATDSYTFGAGFEVALGTELETIFY